jgi:hypothetical protein
MKDHVDVDEQRTSDEELDRWCREIERRLNDPLASDEDDCTSSGCVGCCAGCGPVIDPGE